MKKASIIIQGIGILLTTGVLGYLIGFNSNTSTNTVNPRSYQIQCTQDSIYIYDGEKRIGTVDYDDSSNFSNLILNDNL